MPAPVLRVEALSVHRPRFTLHPLSFSASPGERIALVGPNGAGKSTTMAAIAGRLPIYEGRVYLRGRELREILPEARGNLGFLPEKVPAYEELTVARHFAFLRAFHPRWNEGLVADLTQRLALDPGQAMGKLSKGSRVKVGYIAAEAIEPEVLLLDEPTSGLDPVVRGELLDLVNERLRGHPERVLLFSTHLLEDIDQVADRVLLLRDGRLIDDKRVSEVASGFPTVAQALYQQLRAHA
ncbi:MAG: ABC transporter ATP-binding protein [Gemmatimonadaceae bacterium]